MTIYIYIGNNTPLSSGSNSLCSSGRNRYVHLNVLTYVCIYLYICIYIYIHRHMYMYIYMHIDICICIYIYRHKCVYTFIYICEFICWHIYIYIYIQCPKILWIRRPRDTRWSRGRTRDRCKINTYSVSIYLFFL
jgi:hypothetical protein